MYCPDPTAMDDFLKPVPEPFEGKAKDMNPKYYKQYA
jgi:hypothetical protein